MILIINSSGNDLEFVLDDQYKSVATEKQSLALPVETEKFIAECGAKWADITAIGVVVGPGSFTGIRIGIAYAKGLAMGLGIPVVPINAFELYLAATPDAFVAIDSTHGDLFVAAKNLEPCTMDIDTVETKQMEWPRTVGHKHFDLKLGIQIVQQKLQDNKNEPVIPLYLRPSYVETNKTSQQHQC